MNSWQKLIRTGALAGIMGALLLGGSPARASAQNPLWICGHCQTVIPIHIFHTASAYPIPGTRDCLPGAGGCHVGVWYTGSCWYQHFPCLYEDEDLAAAITSGDESAIFEGLSGATGWSISPSSGELLLEGCGDLILMRASLPSTMTLPPEPAARAASDQSVSKAVGANRW